VTVSAKVGVLILALGVLNIAAFAAKQALA
jgi:hypothetical protein